MALNVPRLHGPNDDFKADTGFHRRRGEKHEPERLSVSPVRGVGLFAQRTCGFVYPTLSQSARKVGQLLSVASTHFQEADGRCGSAWKALSDRSGRREYERRGAHTRRVSGSWVTKTMCCPGVERIEERP